MPGKEVKKAAKPAPKTAAKPAAKPAAKTAAKPAAKTAAKPVAKTAAKPVAKTAAKPAKKPTVKPAVKPAAKAAAPYKKPAATSSFVARPKNFGIGHDVPYARDLSRFMRWPTFVTMQRKKRVLQRRLKVPPALHQFTKVLDRSSRNELLKLVKKYPSETRRARRQRLFDVATEKKKNPEAASKKAPLSVVTGLQEVTRTIEKKTARLVMIANNVDPIELVLWMPTLCRANKVPYAIVKDKARLGDAVGQKTATCVAITDVNAEDEAALKNLIRSVNARFLARSDVIRRQWGGLQLSLRSRAELRKKRARNAGKDAAAVM